MLGFDFDAQGRMIAADAMKGLLAIATDGTVSVLTDRVSADDPVRYANSIVVARDGTIYFTDASDALRARRMGRHLRSERARHSGAGGDRPRARLRSGDRAHTQSWRMDSRSPTASLCQPMNTRCSSPRPAATGSGGSIVGARDLDVQSGSAQAGCCSTICPGYPDNLMRGRDGRIWVGLFRPRNPAADGLSQKPFMRKVLLRLPRSLLPVAIRYGHVFAFDEDGRVTEDLQDPSRRLSGDHGRHRNRGPSLHP